MPEYKFEYNGYSVTITENPIYHDFEFVVKTLDEKKVIGTSSAFIKSHELAESAAKQFINNL